MCLKFKSPHLRVTSGPHAIDVEQIEPANSRLRLVAPLQSQYMLSIHGSCRYTNWVLIVSKQGEARQRLSRTSLVFRNVFVARPFCVKY